MRNERTLMPVDSHARQHVHELVEQLDPAQIAAVSRLLEVMVEAEEEPLSEEDARVVAASREHFKKNPEAGVSFEEFAAECGFSMEQNCTTVRTGTEDCVNGRVREYLSGIAAQDDRAAEARARIRQVSRRSNLRLGRPTWTREEQLHER